MIVPLKSLVLINNKDIDCNAFKEFRNCNCLEEVDLTGLNITTVSRNSMDRHLPLKCIVMH
jgi:hypothetical protein